MKHKLDNTDVNPVLEGTALHEAVQQLTNRQIVISPVGDSLTDFSTGFRIDDLNRVISDLTGEFGKLSCIIEISGDLRRFAIATGRRRRRIPDSDMKQATQRLCDCLKCRMGKPNQCTTYSPKKRRGK